MNRKMIKQKCDEMIERHSRCSRSSESFLLLFFSYAKPKMCSLFDVRCVFDDLLHFKAVDSLDTLLDSFLRRHEKLSGIVSS